ncbi:MAG: PIN domain nuclease [Thermoprotei archaeon]|nr:MAG: PIN domain nuclease [Thermoprotei archaeon]
MERGRAVVDATVVVKWFVEEEHSREARFLRDAYASGLIDLAAPSLLPYEVINALKYSGAFGEDELKEVARALEDYQIALYDLVGGVAQRAIEIAMRRGVTVYDAAYVALAYELDTVLYTADERLLRRVGRERVAHIAEFRL